MFELLEVEPLPDGGYEVAMICQGKRESTFCQDVESVKKQLLAYINAAAVRTARLHSELSILEDTHARR